MVSAVCSVSALRSLGQGIKLKWKLEDFHFHMHRYTHLSNLHSGDAKAKDVQETSWTFGDQDSNEPLRPLHRGSEADFCKAAG